VVAYGAALAGRPNALRLQMDQSQRQVRGDGGEPLAWGPLVMVTLLMAFMAVSTETRLRGAEKKEKMMRASLVDAISPVVPNAKDLPSEQLVKALRDQLAKQKAVARSSPARLMNTLGKGAESVINKEGAYLNLVTFEDGKLKWEGYTKTLKDSEDVRLGLEKVMDEVEQVRTRPSRDGFVFQIEGKPRDS
jgi:hypothetical protein